MSKRLSTLLIFILVLFIVGCSGGGGEGDELAGAVGLEGGSFNQPDDFEYSIIRALNDRDADSLEFFMRGQDFMIEGTMSASEAADFIVDNLLPDGVTIKSQGTIPANDYPQFNLDPDASLIYTTGWDGDGEAFLVLEPHPENGVYWSRLILNP